MGSTLSGAIQGLGTLPGDADRERAEVRLRRAYVDGRLELEELERRLRQVAAARTRAELLLALRGLPGAAREALAPAVAPARARARAAGLRAEAAALRAHAGAFLAVNGTTLGVWGLTGADGLWPLVVAVPTAALLGGHVGVSPSRRARRRGR